jgi:hypothetical protein
MKTGADGGILNQQTEPDGDDETDEIKPLQPLHQITGFGAEVMEIKWVFNDSLIVLITAQRDIVILDSLL